MNSTGLKMLAFVTALGMTGASCASETGAADTSALARWQADPATIFDATEIDLSALLWLARPVVVFADSPADPAFRTQIELLEARLDELVERDVILVTDTNPAAGSDLRRRLRPRGFMLVLIGKDGGVKLRKPFPWHVRELTRSIDKIPLRQQEIRDRLNAGE